MFPRPTAEELAVALKGAGLSQVQLNLNALGFPTIPTRKDLESIDLLAIANSFCAHGLTLWGLSATYNMAQPDAAGRRKETLAAAEYLRAVPEGIAICGTLCTGTRDADNMWRTHPDNQSEDAWRDFRAELAILLEATAGSGLLLGVEPEAGNVVTDTNAAVRLLDELGADASRIGLILDPANLVSAHPRAKHAEVLTDAFERLGDRAVCIHIKDTVPWADTLAGAGRPQPDVDYILANALELPLN